MLFLISTFFYEITCSPTTNQTVSATTSPAQRANSGQTVSRQGVQSGCHESSFKKLTAVASKVHSAVGLSGDCRFYQTGANTTQAHGSELNRTIAHTDSDAANQSAFKQGNPSTSSQMRPEGNQTVTSRTNVMQIWPQLKRPVASGSNQITRPVPVLARPGLNTTGSAKKTVQKLGTSRTLGPVLAPLKPNSSSDSSSSEDDQPPRPPRILGNENKKVYTRVICSADCLNFLNLRTHRVPSLVVGVTFLINLKPRIPNLVFKEKNKAKGCSFPSYSRSISE